MPIAIFMDLSKAFDTLNHDILIYKLKSYGLSEAALKLMQSYLTNRKQYVEINNTQSTKNYITVGVPQGSILGPLLFIIYINDIIQDLTRSNKIAIQGAPQMAVDKEAISLSRVYS